MDRYSGNVTHFSISMMQIFPPSQKIAIPKYNAVSYSETNFFSAAVKNSFNMPGVNKSFVHTLCTINHKFYKLLCLIIF